jgi:hypothetical protein
MKKICFIACLLATIGAVAQKTPKKKPVAVVANPMQLDSSRDNLTAYMKMRASLDEKQESVFYATGSIYSFVPDERQKLLFNFEMYNIARIEKMAGDSGYRLITREMLVYKDPKTDSILTQWKNPWTNEIVEVIPVWNDPVNQRFYAKNWMVPYQRLGDGRINFYNDVPLFYPSPLKKADYPDNSRSDNYQGGEFFNFFCAEGDLNNAAFNSVNADISWTRFSDFLPWMRMAAKPGNLFYQSRGWKVKNGFAGLPKHIQEFVLKNKPEYATAPASYVSPNMTSWKYFKKVMDEKKGQ